MKLHLPKALLTAVMAWGAFGAAAYAEETETTYPYDVYNGYGYTIVQWTGGQSGKTNGLCYGTYQLATYNSTTHGFELSTNASYDSYGEVVTSSNYCTIMFDSSSNHSNGDVYYDIGSVKLSGIIVDATSNVDKLYGSSGNGRSMSLGGGVDNKSGYSYIGRNFELNLAQTPNAGQTTTLDIIGTQTWDVESGVTYTINTGANVMTQSGALTITGGGTVAISKAFVNNGTITIDSGSALQVTDINALSKSIAWDDTMTENGAVGVNYVVTTGEGSITGDVKYTVNGTEKTATLTNATYFTEGSVYGVVKDSNLSDIVEGVNTNGANIIAIKEGVTLTQDSAGTFTNSQSLAGNGTYDLGAVEKNGANAKLGTDLTLDSSWTGTVSLSGGEARDCTGGANSVNNYCVQSINFNDLGHAGSTVEIAADGLYGYLSVAGSTTGTYNPNIKLIGDLTIQNGNSSAVIIFAGKFSGDGNLVLARYGGGTNTYTS